MTAANTDRGGKLADNAGDSRFAVNIGVAGVVLLIVAGVVGWVAMGPTLFHLMATGIGWLCM
ncbi:MAG: hypothetical protein R3D43_07760 [Tepidamorphaceae bacterium]